MKKIIAYVIAATLLLSALAVCILPAVASEDMFFVSTTREDYFLSEDDRKSVPGYKYTDEGFMVNPMGEGNEDYVAKYPNNTPYIGVQTAEQENLMAGFYMEVRVDNFKNANDAGVGVDNWFGFSVWDSHWVTLGPVGTDEEGRDWGHGVETLVRGSIAGKYTPGLLEWYNDTEGVKRVHTGNNTPSVIEKDGHQYLTLEIKYNTDTSKYEVVINNTKAPVAYCDALTAWLEARGHKAYVGVHCQTALRDGEASFTITRIGDTKDTAIVPSTGPDTKAVQHTNTFDPCADRDSVDEGEPAFIISGDPDTYKYFKVTSGSASLSITEDGTFTFSARHSTVDPMFRLPNDVSYDLRDFPIAMVILKDYCACTYTDLDFDTIPDPMCFDYETIEHYYFSGEGTDGNGAHRINMYKLPNLTLTDEDGHTYTVFLGDFTEKVAEFEGEQRIHGMMPRFTGVKYTESGRGEWEIIEMGHFATAEDAENYAYSLIDTLVGYPEEETQPPVDTDPTDDPDETETTAVETDTQPAEDTQPTETESKSEATESQPKETEPKETESKPAETDSKPQETESKKPAETQPKDDGGDGSSSGGCGSVAGFGALAIVAVAGIGLACFKKKED